VSIQARGQSFPDGHATQSDCADFDVAGLNVPPRAAVHTRAAECARGGHERGKDICLTSRTGSCKDMPDEQDPVLNNPVRSLWVIDIGPGGITRDITDCGQKVIQVANRSFLVCR
jgi:hypothetical protein